MAITQAIRNQLKTVIEKARIRVIGEDLLKNDAEAHLLLAFIKAYGDEASSFIYISPSRARSGRRPPDLALCHPGVGLLIVEAKGHSITGIEGVTAGSLLVRYQNRLEPVNVIRQTEDQMYEIENDLLKLLPDRRDRPLINCMVAFPNVSEDEWRERGYNQAHPCAQLLFKEQIADPARLSKRIHSLVLDALKQSRRSEIISEQQVEAILRMFGNSDVINESRAMRPQVEEHKLGAYLDDLNALDKYLSEEQKQLAQMIVDGSPRLIRGVAGSGKSVVLAELVARYLHRQLPDWDSMALPEADLSIAVVCFNHTLVDFLKRKIQAAYRLRTLTEEIPSQLLLVTHLNQLLWTLKQRGWPLEYISVKKAPDPRIRAAHYRSQIAAFAERNPLQYQALCLDAIFIDEGQDFEPEEFRLLLDVLKTHPQTGEKTLVICYDDAQNLYGRARPVWRDVGVHIVGERSRVMRTCHRNSRQIAEMAFNVLIGAQAPTDSQVQTRTYADMAYLKEHGLIEETAKYVHVRFAPREDRIPIVKAFPNHQAEINWVAQEVVRLLREEEVRAEDILLLFNQPSFINRALLKQQILAQLPTQRFLEPFGDSEDKDRYIFRPDHLTMSTVHGAKGYDAPIVFLIGADHFEQEKKGRAAFYVAATRAKMLLYISGVARGSSLLTEAEAVHKQLAAI